MTIPIRTVAAPVEGAAADAADLEETRRLAVRSLEGAFSQLFTQMRRAYAQAAEVVSPGMMPGTFKMFTVIERMGSASVSGLAERLDVDKSMISRSVSELEGLGLVERTADPDDGRIRLISITALGRERLESVRYPYLDRLGDVLSEWPLEQIDRLSVLLLALASGEAPRD
ncbi:MarR family winged helix-turn-helix transcriptional regulator [Microbacterium sp.]|uniref:MarR family winged helix-turn-helix transcriptional regulator n=1 Tax=Microbacterium sp. TaxID=51671 RepID=UPI003A92538D